MPGLAVLALFAAAAPTAVVLQPVANMYSRPSADADVVSQAIYGANVGIVEQKDGWAHIRTADDYLGWTPLAALLPGKAYATSGRVAEVQSLFAHIYRESSVTRHAPLITVPFESGLEVVPEPKPNPIKPRAGSRCACPTIMPVGCRRAMSRSSPGNSPFPKPWNSPNASSAC